MTAPRIVILPGADGAMAIKADNVEAIIPCERGGCTVATSARLYDSIASFDEVIGQVWPEPEDGQ